MFSLLSWSFSSSYLKLFFVSSIGDSYAEKSSKIYMKGSNSSIISKLMIGTKIENWLIINNIFMVVHFIIIFFALYTIYRLLTGNAYN